MISTTLTTTVLSLLSLAAAVPQHLSARQNLLPGQIPGIERHDLCPAGWQYRVNGACFSGFVGCARKDDQEVCNGPSENENRMRGKCIRPEYGNYRVCTNGFYGCDANHPDVCAMPGTDWEPTQVVPTVDRMDLCPPEAPLFKLPGQCDSGFVGCIKPDDKATCDHGSKRYFKTCNGYGTYKECKTNGFYGCTTEENICDRSHLVPAGPLPKLPEPAPAPPSNDAMMKFCPAGTNYYAPGECSSAFVGCGTEAACGGEKRFWWGDCAAGTGTFYICAKSKFVGCTTVQNPYPCN